MVIKALDLFNNLKQYTEEELKELNVTIEVNRNKDGSLGQSEYANIIENYPSQIRIINRLS